MQNCTGQGSQAWGIGRKARTLAIVDTNGSMIPEKSSGWLAIEFDVIFVAFASGLDQTLNQGLNHSFNSGAAVKIKMIWQSSSK